MFFTSTVVASIHVHVHVVARVFANIIQVEFLSVSSVSNKMKREGREL